MEKIIDLEERIPTFREKRRKRTNIKFTLLIGIFVAIICVLLYFQSSMSDVKKIEISGAVIREPAFYEEQLQLQKGDSMWSFKTDDLESALTQFPWVKEVSVERQLLNTIKVSIKEWAKVAYIAELGTFYPVLENGEVLRDEVEMVPIDAPIFNVTEDEGLRQRLLKELSKLDKGVLSMISQITLSNAEADKYSVTLFMNDGYEVRADITTLAKKLNYYPSIVAQIDSAKAVEKGIIDMEVGSYYKAYSDVYLDLSFNGTKKVKQSSVESEEDVLSTVKQSEEDAGEQQAEAETEGSDT